MRELVVLVAIASGCAPARIWSGHTADRRHTIEVQRDGGLDHVLVDGRRRGAYRGIAGWSVALAGEHMVFAARIGKQWAVVRDGRVDPERWDGIGELRLSPTGALVYSAERHGGWYVVQDGSVGPRHDAILANTLRVAGAHVAYVARQGNGSRVVVDGQPQALFDGIGRLALHADGRVAYTGRRGLDVHAVIDGAIGPAREHVSLIELGPRGRSAYAATIDGETRLVIDGEVGPAVDSIRLVQFSDDGSRVAWLGRIGKLDVLALDEAPVAAWAARREPKFAFRPGSAQLAFVESLDSKERVVVDGVAGKTFDEVRTPVWGPRGVIYAARRDATWVIVDGEREIDAGEDVGDPVVTSTRVGYGGRRGNSSYVSVDGEVFTFDLVFTDTVTFSRDGRRWAAVVGDRKREQLYIVVDGTRRVPVAVHELYSSVASGSTSALVDWTRAEVERD